MMKHIYILILLLATLAPLQAQQNMDLRDVLPYNERTNDVWGYADTNGNEYALVGTLTGLSIVNVTDPDSIFELHFISGPSSTWRDIKTWKDHAYVTNESSEGLLIIDLGELPDSITTTTWIADSSLRRAHNIYIDENGFGYCFGYNDTALTVPFDSRGALIIDLNGDPMLPTVAGAYSTSYVHDGFVRGDTLWSAEIQNGLFGVVDVSDKANPVLLGDNDTPNRFTHNCWLSDDGKTLFTTDERPGAFIASYDVSDLANITELDRYQAAPGSKLIPHNTHVLGDYLVTSYYKYGISIIDATNPANLVEVGYYDTSPLPNSEGFSGCWGAYPFLPSGNILATDIEEGLFVLTPTFTRAAYIEGVIIEETKAIAEPEVRVEIMGTGLQEFTEIDGAYKMGVAEPGNYDIRLFKNGCVSKIITNVELLTGQTTTLNEEIACTAFVTSTAYLEDEISYLTAQPSVFSQQTKIFFDMQGYFSNNAYINLYNIKGQQLFSYHINTPMGEVQLGSQLANGVYMVQLVSNELNRSIKILKN